MTTSNTLQDSYDQASRYDRQIAVWLLVVCTLIFAMVVLGGVTRLTHSGLSMTDWKPVTGWLPPLSDQAWLAEFERYKQFPEYKKVNFGIDLAGFKSIFWFEFSHRVLGRSIGLIYLIPFLFFLWRKRVSGALMPKLWLMFVLGGLQGFLGWWMVSSGLVDRPDVSHYRLTAHLGLAIVIYAYGLWIAMALLKPAAAHLRDRIQKFYRVALMLVGAIFVVILSGGLVAGLDAGFAYNTFPTMNGQWIPDGIAIMSPWFVNIFENTITVQFDHRWLAIATSTATVIFWFRATRIDLSTNVRIIIHLLLVSVVMQVTLGIVTLVNVVPVSAAAAHQAGALVLLTAALAAAHALRVEGT
jgi:cytochrome c oxidase assembly protein subunit 15